MDRSDRIDRILRNDIFILNMEKNGAAEADRCFCRHDMSHLLDVARIGMILNLREQQGVEEELIYAAGLLHDIGRHLQYSEGIPHEQASAEIALPVLRECGFGDGETDIIVSAICAHRDRASASEKGLAGILYRADKASRPCFSCKVRSECNWKEDKKNMIIQW